MVTEGQEAPLTVPCTLCKLTKFLKEQFTTELKKIVVIETLCGCDKVWALPGTCCCSVGSRAKDIEELTISVPKGECSEQRLLHPDKSLALGLC